MMLKDQLRLKRFNLIVMQKSAEGIVGCTPATEGLNKSRRVIVGEVFLNGTC